ncbi:MAG TPA: molybdenum cofactor biosynthesis protein MoaE [Nannocystis exedens]|nr:molybdenum cofactor biosynthesis protein MoaE [Nannocystis exedens]
MKLQILLFAAIRSKLGSELIDIEVPADACARDLLRIIGECWPQVADLLPSCRVAIDQRFADPDERLRERVEIAVIPPVSGGHDGAPRSRISDQPLELAAIVAAVSHRGAGGINSFIGNVRGHSQGHEISHLEYEAYEPMALRSIDTIISRVEAAIEGARLAIHHRRGRLEVGETAVIIAASAPHRAAAFEACRAAIEALKREVPIWKREVTTTGETWFGRGP